MPLKGIRGRKSFNSSKVFGSTKQLNLKLKPSHTFNSIKNGEKSFPFGTIICAIKRFGKSVNGKTLRCCRHIYCRFSICYFYKKISINTQAFDAGIILESTVYDEIFLHVSLSINEDTIFESAIRYAINFRCLVRLRIYGALLLLNLK